MQENKTGCFFSEQSVVLSVSNIFAKFRRGYSLRGAPSTDRV